MTERNDISYNKAYNIMNSYKKEIEANAAMNNTDKYGKRASSNLSSGIYNNQNNINNSNISSGRNTPKYSSNILNKKPENLNAANNLKLLNNNVNNKENNENNLNDNVDNKGNISIKFINHNINHFIISNNNNSNGNLNNSKTANQNLNILPGANFSGNNNNPQSPSGGVKDSSKPEKKSKKINAFRNVAKPQTAMGNQFNNFNKEVNSKSNLNNLNRIQNSNIGNNNNIRLPDNFDMNLNKKPNTPNNQNFGVNNNYDNIMVNYSQPLQPGIFSKYNIKQLNINNSEFSPVNRISRGSLNLHSTINKNNTNNNNNSLRFSNKDNQIHYSRPSSASNSKNKQNKNNNNHLRDRSSNSMKDPYNNPSIIATIKRTPSTNSLVKSLTRNYSKHAVGNENMPNSNNHRGFLNINRQTPKNYSGNLEMNKNGEFIRNSYNSINMMGIEKPKTGNKMLNSNNLNINRKVFE